MKQFRKDRLHTSDRERIQYLTDFLKRIRVHDDQQVCTSCYGGCYASNYGTSPNRTGQGKSWSPDHPKGGSSPTKISPSKTSGATGQGKFSDSSHTNNGQVMTQISAIYAKRSRSILN